MTTSAKVKIIVIGLDGIILNTRKSAETFIKEKINPDFQLPDETHDIYEIAKKLENPLSFIEQFTEANEWSKIEILPNIKDGLKTIKDKECKVILISQMEKYLQNDIEKRLKDEGLEFDAFIATGRPQEHQNLFNFYADILKPKIWLRSSLSSTAGVTYRNIKFGYISNLPEHENKNYNYAKHKDLNSYVNNNIEQF